MRVPNAERALVAIEKLADYCLDPENEVGQHKAKVFESVLGLKREHANQLRRVLLRAVMTEDAVAGSSDSFGDRYRVDFDIEFNGRKSRLRSVWIIEPGRMEPRLVTCYII